jgi:hypothetical protein
MHFVRSILMTIFCLSAVPSGSEEAESSINFAYSVFAGTGKYRIDDRTIYVFRAPLVFDLKTVDYDAGEKWGVSFLLPVAVGVTYFEDDEELPELSVDDLQSLILAPGLEFPFALKKNWLMKPFAHAGLGVDAKSDAKTFVWGTGIRSSATLGEDSNWLVGAEFLWAGNNSSNDDLSTSLSRWGIGAEYKIPTKRQLFGHRISWNARLIQWYFSDAVNFEPPLRPFRLEHSTEVGISIRFDRPFNILGFQLRQAGIGVEKSDDYDAITLFSSFPF